jgi:hypothetical protein
MQVKFNTTKFDADMRNFINYSIGFLEGIEHAKPTFFKEFGKGIIIGLNKYIDAHARSNQQALHHVYEWYKTGSPEARLFNLTSAPTINGIVINSTFRQSKTLSKDSKTIFRNKAQIMEDGKPVEIVPKKGLLAFDIDGQTIFTRKSVTVNNPGGSAVTGSYQKTFDSFFKNYFSQSFLRASGILNYLEDVSIYKNNLKSGIKGGASVGKSTGYRWLINAKIGVE